MGNELIPVKNCTYSIGKAGTIKRAPAGSAIPDSGRSPGRMDDCADFVKGRASTGVPMWVHGDGEGGCARNGAGRKLF